MSVYLHNPRAPSNAPPEPGQRKTSRAIARGGPGDGRLLDFTRSLITFRAEHPTFRRRSFLTGGTPRGSGLPDVWWFRPDGRKMTQRDWGREYGPIFTYRMGRTAVVALSEPELSAQGLRARPETFRRSGGRTPS